MSLGFFYFPKTVPETVPGFSRNIICKKQTFLQKMQKSACIRCKSVVFLHQLRETPKQEVMEMRRFEIGNRYEERNGSCEKYEVVSRTEKFVTMNKLQHTGRSNERISATKKLKVCDWNGIETVFFNNATIQA